MRLIERIHGQTPGSNDKKEIEAHNHKVPFWVRYYDIVVNLIALGKTRTVHRQTLSLAGLQPGEAVLDIGCGTGSLLLEAEKIVWL